MARDLVYPSPQRTEFEETGKRATDEPTYTHLSLDDFLLCSSTTPNFFPCWDHMQYEKINVVLTGPSIAVKHRGEKEVVLAQEEVVKFERTVYTKSGTRRTRYEMRRVEHYAVWHNDGRVETCEKEPSPIVFWDQQAALLYAIFRNPDLGMEEICDKMYGSSLSLSPFSVSSCVQQLEGKGLVDVVMRGRRIRLTPDGEIKLRNYLHRWWGLNGAWKDVYQEKLPSDLLDFMRLKTEEPQPVLKKDRKNFPEREPKRKPKVGGEEEERRERMSAFYTPMRKPRRVYGVGYNEMHVVQLMGIMTEESDKRLIDDVMSSTSDNVKEASRRVLLQRYPMLTPVLPNLLERIKKRKFEESGGDYFSS